MRHSLPLWQSREPSDLSGVNSDSPPCLAWKNPLEFLLRFICRTVSAYKSMVHCSIFLFNYWLLFFLIHYFWLFRLLSLLFSDPGNVFHAFQSLNWSHYLQLRVNKHQYMTKYSPTSVLVQGVLKAYTMIDRREIYRTNFSAWGQEWATETMR